MDLDYTRIVLNKIQKFEPELATKIIGYLLLQDHSEQEMVQLASCPDHMIREVALRAKTEIQRYAAKPAMHTASPPVNPQKDFGHLSAISSRNPTFPAGFQVPSPFWEPHSANSTISDCMEQAYLDSIPQLQKQTRLFSLVENHIENHIDHLNAGNGGIGEFYNSMDMSAGNLSGKPGRRFSGLSEFPVKICHYFNKGFCKHGSNCRYYHGQVGPENLSQMYGNDGSGDDQVVSPGSLAQLESEIVELLKPRRGNPISIASLPMAYYDKYNKVLQAEGYLTESQRHGKSGYSLTKLLARLKNSIQLIDRPHGQHAVVLAEDAPKFMEKGDLGQNISASRQIYLTFPADSTFTEEDVSNYFSTFGCVEDVRIPCQQRRMFGFVTFVDPETVKMILEKGTPHYVNSSRVLVKPYREKSKLIDRKYSERNDPPFCYSPHYVDADSELTPIPRSCGNARSMRRQLAEEAEQAFELERKRLAKLRFAQKPVAASPRLGFSMDGFNGSEEHFNFHPVEPFTYDLNDKPRYTDTNFNDDDGSQALNLPDSPFSFPIDSGISAVI